MADQFIKPDSDTLDYVIDYNLWLAGDGINSSSWSVEPAGLTIDSDVHTPSSATVWLSGGTNEQSYIVKNTITTAAGRVKSRAIRVLVQEISK